MIKKWVKHTQPVWQEKANFIIGANTGDIDQYGNEIWEQLWSRQISENSYEVCCIPFFIYNISLGDEVSTGTDYIISGVIKPSGHYTFRVWFGDTPDPEIREIVIKELTENDCLYERYSYNLIAVDAPNMETAQAVASYLRTMEDKKLLVFETGKL